MSILKTKFIENLQDYQKNNSKKPLTTFSWQYILAYVKAKASLSFLKGALFILQHRTMLVEGNGVFDDESKTLFFEQHRFCG